MKKDNIKLSIFWLFSFLVIIFMMAFNSHAASLPYYVDNDNFEWNGYSISDIQSYINQKFINDGIPSYSVDLINNVTLIYQGYENNSPYLAIYTKSNTQDTKYYFGNWSIGIQNFDTDINSVTCSFTKCYRILLKLNTNNTLGWKTWYPNQAQSFNLFGSNFYPLYINGLFYDNSYVGGVLKEGENVVLTNIANNLIDVGVAIIPPSPIIPEYLNGLTPPSSVPPSYTINNYTWTTQPTFDNSSTLDAIGSIKDFIVWLANNISGEFQNLISNLQGFFIYIGETIQYYGNIIIETLNNLIQNFYDNMKSLVENISNQIGYMIQPLDQDIIWNNISSTSLVTNISTIQTSLSSFQSSFTGVNEPTDYKIPIHLENLPSNLFGIQTTQYIDLGVINGTVKDGLRLFVWAMVTYGLVVTIFDSISNYINGGGDES